MVSVLIHAEALRSEPMVERTAHHRLLGLTNRWTHLGLYFEQSEEPQESFKDDSGWKPTSVAPGPAHLLW